MNRNGIGRRTVRRAVFLGICSLAWGWGAAAHAAPDPLVLLGGRFEVQATWRTADGHTGVGTPAPLTAETGTFWFFSPANVELVVKVLDACSSPSRHFWVFAAGLTDVQVDLTVTDTASGQVKTYRNVQSTPFAPIQDTGAFATCNAAPRCGQGTLAEISQTPRANPELEQLALLMAGTIAAPQALYDRVVADVASIRQQRPALSLLGYFPGYAGDTLVLAVDSPATTPPWDCLNRWYRVEQVEPIGFNFVVLHFAGILNVDKLRADYAALPGVTSVGVDTFIPPPLLPIDSLCAVTDGPRNLYFVWPSGNQPIEYFASEPGSLPVPQGPVAANPTLAARAQRCFVEWTVGH